MHIHANWPKGQVKRIRNLCTNRSEANQISDKFLANLDAMFTEAPTSAHRARPFSRFILPFHTAWARLPVSAIIDAAAKESCTSHRPETITGTVWKPMHRHLGQRVLTLNLGIHEDAEKSDDFSTIWR